MKKVNLLLLIIFFIIIIIIAIYIGIINLNSKEPDNPPVVINTTEFQEVNDRNNYYMVENCVNKFYNYYASIYENKNPEEEDIKKIYNLLDEKYITFKGITIENLSTVLTKINKSVVNIYNLYSAKQSENIDVYIVKGILREEESKALSDFQIILQIDLQNQTFSVLLQDYIEYKYPNLNIEEDIKIELLNSIEKNRNNSYVYEEITEPTYILDLFDRYKEEALYNIELAYEHLDKEYATTKFDNINKFKKYISDKLESNTDIQLKEYLKTEKDNYIQYVCIDNSGYYYIFRETGIKQYTLILDAYTIDLPEFIEKYNSANTVERVGYNIQKCIEAINNKDYAYVYDKLDFEFKAINYPTLGNFEETIKFKLFNKNQVVTARSANEGSTYAYILTISDVENENNKQKMTIIMQLKEGTDFVMSFSFQ